MNKYKFFKIIFYSFILYKGFFVCATLNAETSMDVPLEGKIVDIIDGDTIVLENGQQIRLVGIQAPKLSLNRKDFIDWPLAKEAKTFLEKIVQDRHVFLSYGPQKKDRYDRLLAHVTNDKGEWVQGEMLSYGMARVYIFPDNRYKINDMLVLEQKARLAKKGIWQHTYYSILKPEMANVPNTYQIVEGKIYSISKQKKNIYINFGSDWKKDFTLTIEPEAQKLFLKDNINIEEFNNKFVRVRGWIDQYYGPRIIITYPEQIEIIN
ncbi:MAG: thermonuclease family protein [Alphaproteobacteria bacterium]|nr:thermonuclease family protein [Alphaproteobacteria bacterium]